MQTCGKDKLSILASVGEKPTSDPSLFIAPFLRRLLLIAIPTGGRVNACTITKRQRDVWQHPAPVVVMAR